MGAVVNLFEMRNGDLGIDAGGVEATVAKQLLDKADVRAVLKHVGGAGVPEQVTAPLFTNVSLFDCFGDPVAEVGWADAVAVATDEEGLFGVVE